jgi:hypothetical protein
LSIFIRKHLAAHDDEHRRVGVVAAMCVVKRYACFGERYQQQTNGLVQMLFEHTAQSPVANVLFLEEIMCMLDENVNASLMQSVVSRVVCDFEVRYTMRSSDIAEWIASAELPVAPKLFLENDQGTVLLLYPIACSPNNQLACMCLHFRLMVRCMGAEDASIVRLMASSIVLMDVEKASGVV